MFLPPIYSSSDERGDFVTSVWVIAFVSIFRLSSRIVARITLAWLPFELC